MKRSIPIAIVLCALCPVGLAQMVFFIDAPHDDSKVRSCVGDRPELKPLHAVYTNIIQTRLWPLKLSEVPKLFGPKLDTATNWWALRVNGEGKRSGPQLDHYSANLVLPIFAPAGGTNCDGRMMMWVSGMHTGDPARDKSHTDLYAIGDIGYVEFYSHLDGEKVQTAVIYFRADDKFVPLKSTNHFSARLAWDTARLDALKRWFDSHLLAAKDAKKFPAKESSKLTK
ncbi:MAG: hypothetical protein NTW03_11700 [Verrucomicrobia bacterium]|nr:hypothetical protein [Verrucomicrobiota bacterium]